MLGNSLAIRITRAMANIARLHKGSHVSIEATEQGISIKPLIKKPYLRFSEAELLADIPCGNSSKELLPIHSTRIKGSKDQGASQLDFVSN